MLEVFLALLRLFLNSALGLLSYLWAGIPLWASLGISVLPLSMLTITSPGPGSHFQLGPGLAWWPELLVEPGCPPCHALLSSLRQHRLDPALAMLALFGSLFLKEQLGPPAWGHLRMRVKTWAWKLIQHLKLFFNLLVKKWEVWPLWFLCTSRNEATSMSLYVVWEGWHISSCLGHLGDEEFG